MSELDLLNLARSATQNEVAWFSQMITINFAMVVAIYYFLNQAKLALRIFAYVAYLIGSLTFFGQMLLEANLKVAGFAALRALPHMSGPSRQYVGAYDSWLGFSTSIMFNAAFPILWLGVLYLLFFWKKSAHMPSDAV